MDSDDDDGQSAQYWRGEQLAVDELCHRRRSCVGISRSLRLAGISLLRDKPENASRLGWRPLSVQHKRLRIRELIPLNRQSFPALDDPAHGKLAPLPTN
jgi:hypothetical protein